MTILAFICYILSIGNDRPSTKDLHNHVVQGAAGKWRDFGVQLLDTSTSDRILDIIEKDHPQDVTTCCKCMLRKWLDTNPDASWSQLLDALRSPCVQLDYLADQIEHKLVMNRNCKNNSNIAYTCLKLPFLSTC